MSTHRNFHDHVLKVTNVSKPDKYNLAHNVAENSFEPTLTDAAACVSGSFALEADAQCHALSQIGNWAD
ncbi:MAG: hypothetical protein AAFQ32_08360 [Pseudomonadota bacterium]